ncbi:universal stress protein [Microlunatus soli]|uniref:Nucleotide-binding universal stress protein, UspA family n=1 Tax=Microlunatus soli TaxID=630515 RepID=A0A1H1MDV2_9ACTN|nr:universal stress protein [Microlunatus soli]SDR84810.1 Nucleotide-binding universal stress protein, UspA family [Microlunatus soli]
MTDSGTTSGAASTLVVGYSAKPEGRAALARAIRIARTNDAKVVVVHTSADDEVTDVQDLMESTGLQFDIHQAPDVLDPAEELIKVSESSPDALIVIGLRRRSPVGKLLLGSNAQRVLLDASCPVLAVKAEATAPS